MILKILGAYSISTSLIALRSLIIIFFCFFLQVCKPQAPTATSFYYWRTVFKLSNHEKENLLNNSVTKLYIRYFDITLIDKTAVPVSPISFEERPENLQVVPVIFIKNEVMMGNVNLKDLAAKTTKLIQQINDYYQLSYDEIQLDCDWTLTSKENYFRFIRLIRATSGKALSATIRLHQVKYFQKTGVPEVDRGVLMYYNMGQISADSSNSIYNSDVAARYTASLKLYPLKLDVALPIFSWGVHLRNNHVIGLMGKLNEASFDSDARFARGEIPVYEATEDVEKYGYYFAKGDQIKIEGVSQDQLKEMTADLTEYLASKPKEIIFFDLDSVNMNYYANEKGFFKNISRHF